MDPNQLVLLSDPLTMGVDGQLLQDLDLEAFAQPAFPDQLGSHTQQVFGDNWDDLVAGGLLPDATTDGTRNELVSPQLNLNDSTPATVPPVTHSSNPEIKPRDDAIDVWSTSGDTTVNEGLHSSLNNQVILPHSLSMDNACETNSSAEMHSLASSVQGTDTASAINPSDHPNTGISPAQQVFDAKITNGYIPDPNFDLRMDYFDATTDTNVNAVPAQEVYKTSDANGLLRQNLAGADHDDGASKGKMPVEPTQRNIDLIVPGSDHCNFREEKTNVSENHDSPCENDLCYDSKSGLLYSRGGSSAQKSPHTEQQNLTVEEMEAILGKRVFIVGSDEAEEPSAKRQCLEENHDGEEHGNGGVSDPPKPPFVILGRSNEGNFWYETIKVYNRAICAHCDKVFPFQELLNAHIQSKHAETPKKRTYRKRKLVKIHQCDVCKGVYMNAANLRRHKDIVHGRKIIAVCEHCDAPFSSQHGLTLHKRDIHNQVPSSVAKRYGPNVYEERALKKQRLSIDNNIGWLIFSCASCGHWSESKGNMQRHIRTFHMGLREFPCKYCPLEFKTKSNRDLHYISKHPGKSIMEGESDVQGDGDA